MLWVGYDMYIKNMKSSLKKFPVYLLVLPVVTLCSLLPKLTWAEDDSKGVALETVNLINPLKIGSIEGLLVAILNIIVVLMIPIIVLFIILAGFNYVTARGNATKIQDATRALMYAIIGGVLVLGASAISVIIKSTVDAF